MSLVLNTNCGFVSSTPTSDPEGNAQSTIDTYVRSIKDTSPASANIITEIGWYCNNASGESNFEVGIYSDNSGAPENLLHSIPTNAKGTGAGWKKATGLNLAINPSTIYHIAVQLDDTDVVSYIDTQTGVSGAVYYYRATMTSLPDPFNGTVGTADRLIAVYAVYGTSSGGFLNRNYWWFQ
jgi:hypothetical protein